MYFTIVFTQNSSMLNINSKLVPHRIPRAFYKPRDQQFSEEILKVILSTSPFPGNDSSQKTTLICMSCSLFLLGVPLYQGKQVGNETNS